MGYPKFIVSNRRRKNPLVNDNYKKVSTYNFLHVAWVIFNAFSRLLIFFSSKIMFFKNYFMITWMSNSFGSRSGLTKCWAWSAIHVYNVSHSFDPDQAQQNKVCHHHLYPNCVKFSHSFGTRSGPTNIRPDLGPNKQRLSADGKKKKHTESHNQNNMSRDMRFPTMWYVRPAKAQTSLRIRAVWSEP